MRNWLSAAAAFAAAMMVTVVPVRSEDVVKFGVAAEPYAPFSSQDASGEYEAITHRYFNFDIYR